MGYPILVSEVFVTVQSQSLDCLWCFTCHASSKEGGFGWDDLEAARGLGLRPRRMRRRWMMDTREIARKG